MSQEVAVVGAGIIGLSSALAIQRELPAARVTIVADRFDRDTTSIGAGGIFVPTSLGADADTFNMWASDGAKHFYDIAFSEESGTSGVNLITGYEVMNKLKTPEWFPYMLYAAEMNDALLQRFSPYYRFGYVFTTVIVEGPKYLPWLMKRFKDNGGQVIERKIQSFEELHGKYDVVVNCTGLGSKELLHDLDLHSARGHIVRVSAPWIKHFVHTDDGKYILPSSETVAIGGFKQMGRTDMAPVASEGRNIWTSMKERFPALEGSKILYDWIGLRPMRSKVRLEKETLNFKGKQMQVIHNYGHGSFGISLSWGTGVHVARILAELMKHKAKL